MKPTLWGRGTALIINGQNWELSKFGYNELMTIHKRTCIVTIINYVVLIINSDVILVPLK